MRPESPSGSGANGRPSRRAMARELPLTAALAGIWLFFAWQEPVFLSGRNLSLLSVELAITATLALGMLIVLLPGQIDLSAGSGVGLAGGVAAVLTFSHRWPAPAALAAALAGAVLVWSAMGTLIARERVPAFIITLGGLLTFRGVHWWVIDSSTIPVVEGGRTNLFSLLTTYYLSPMSGFALAAVAAGLTGAAWRHRSQRRRAYGVPDDDAELLFLKWFLLLQALLLGVIVANSFRGVPLALVILGAVALFVHQLTMHTPFGRYLYAIGGNEDAAILSGVPVQATIVGAFALMGAIVALTGFMQTAYAGASTTTVGSLMELDAVAACVIGGTSLRGGRGSVSGVLVGSLIMASLLNGMTLMAVTPEVKYVARGIVLALAVWLDLRLTAFRSWQS